MGTDGSHPKKGSIYGKSLKKKNWGQLSKKKTKRGESVMRMRDKKGRCGEKKSYKMGENLPNNFLEKRVYRMAP